MRLWHQSFTVLDNVPAYRAVLEHELRRLAAPGTEVVLHGMDPDTYRSAYPGEDIRYVHVQALHAQQILRNVRQAERQGYDGFMISTLPDAGLIEARTLVDIPVVGYGQSSMQVAAMSGYRFGIICMIRELAPLYSENVRRYGLGGQFVGAHWLGMEFAEVSRGYDEPGPVLAAFEAKVRELLSLGLEVVIPGEAVLNAVIQKAGLRRIGDVPIVDGLAATLKNAEMMAQLQRLTGLSHARVSYFSKRPPAGRLEELDRAYFGRSAEEF